ncbi:MAG: hypothetical protein D6701_06330, partial [Gemmatimonadetes bacterium]
MKRRRFVKTGLTLGAAALVRPGGAGGAGPSGPDGRADGRVDLVIRGGTVVDGTGAAAREADVAISGGRITAVGRVDAAGADVIDARGLAVTPGFIDIHSHADLALLVDPTAPSRIHQGVTLEVVGQDGSSVGPWTPQAARETRERYRRDFGVDLDFDDLGGFFAAVDRVRPAVNVASMVGHGTLRAYVVGLDDRPASRAELDRMRGLVSHAVEQGAVGLSSGLEYTPGSFAPTDELVHLAGALSGTGYPYASHMRNEDDRLLAAVEEALHVGRMAGVPVQISHLKAQGRRNWWKADAVLRAVEDAVADGLDVRFDRYPYVAYATGLSNLFPTWARARGTGAFMARLDDPSARARMEEAVRAKVALLGSWDAVQISSAPPGEFAWLQGRRLGEAAREAGVEPFELTVRVMRAARGQVGMIGFGMSEENTARILAHPLGMLCSDGGAYAPEGPLHRGRPHPRAYGSFPRFFARYVRERGDLSLEDAVHKVTGAPAG